MSTDLHPIRRALITVSDKTGLVDVASALLEHGVTLLSTGGTATALRQAGLPVTEVAQVTQFPEIMDGRVKTLHPMIHAGLLGRAGVDDAVMAEHAIAPIDLLVLNLYPFKQTVARPECTLDQAIAQIDIGGPAMLRSAAKNYLRVAVVTDPSQYSDLLAQLQANQGQLSLATRFAWSVIAFAHVTEYDAAISNYLSSVVSPTVATPQLRTYPQHLTHCYQKSLDLRYGENPHQTAAFYRTKQPQSGCFATFEHVHGKALSYNNLADAQTAWDCVRQFDQAACVIVKHANPCGVALAPTCHQAYAKAYQTDPTSAFGGIIAINQCLDRPTLQAILAQQFVEVIIAPDVAPDASDFALNKPNLRILRIPQGPGVDRQESRTLGSGLLVQSADIMNVKASQLDIVSERAPTAEQIRDLLFAWHVAKYVKSNAIVYAKHQQTMGIGAGQMSRVYSARIAGIKAADAQLVVSGSVMASDAFFPFRDSIDAAAQAGITAVIQPGGSRRDAEVIAAANAQQMVMVLTHIRHFRH